MDCLPPGRAWRTPPSPTQPGPSSNAAQPTPLHIEAGTSATAGGVARTRPAAPLPAPHPPRPKRAQTFAAALDRLGFRDSEQVARGGANTKDIDRAVDCQIAWMRDAHGHHRPFGLPSARHMEQAQEAIAVLFSNERRTLTAAELQKASERLVTGYLRLSGDTLEVEYGTPAYLTGLKNMLSELGIATDDGFNGLLHWASGLTSRQAPVSTRPTPLHPSRMRELFSSKGVVTQWDVQMLVASTSDRSSGRSGAPDRRFQFARSALTAPIAATPEVRHAFLVNRLERIVAALERVKLLQSGVPLSANDGAELHWLKVGLRSHSLHELLQSIGADQSTGGTELRPSSSPPDAAARPTYLTWMIHLKERLEFDLGVLDTKIKTIQARIDLHDRSEHSPTPGTDAEPRPVHRADARRQPTWTKEIQESLDSDICALNAKLEVSRSRIETRDRAEQSSLSGADAERRPFDRAHEVLELKSLVAARNECLRSVERIGDVGFKRTLGALNRLLPVLADAPAVGSTAAIQDGVGPTDREPVDAPAPPGPSVAGAFAIDFSTGAPTNEVEAQAFDSLRDRLQHADADTRALPADVVLHCVSQVLKDRPSAEPDVHQPLGDSEAEPNVRAPIDRNEWGRLRADLSRFPDLAAMVSSDAGRSDTQGTETAAARQRLTSIVASLLKGPRGMEMVQRLTGFRELGEPGSSRQAEFKVWALATEALATLPETESHNADRAWLTRARDEATARLSGAAGERGPAGETSTDRSDEAGNRSKVAFNGVNRGYLSIAEGSDFHKANEALEAVVRMSGTDESSARKPVVSAAAKKAMLRQLVASGVIPDRRQTFKDLAHVLDRLEHWLRHTPAEAGGDTRLADGLKSSGEALVAASPNRTAWARFKHAATRRVTMPADARAAALLSAGAPGRSVDGGGGSFEALLDLARTAITRIRDAGSDPDFSDDLAEALDKVRAVQVWAAPTLDGTTFGEAMADVVRNAEDRHRTRIFDGTVTGASSDPVGALDLLFGYIKLTGRLTGAEGLKIEFGRPSQGPQFFIGRAQRESRATTFEAGGKPIPFLKVGIEHSRETKSERMDGVFVRVARDEDDEPKTLNALCDAVSDLLSGSEPPPGAAEPLSRILLGHPLVEIARPTQAQSSSTTHVVSATAGINLLEAVEVVSPVDVNVRVKAGAGRFTATEARADAPSSLRSAIRSGVAVTDTRHTTGLLVSGAFEVKAPAGKVPLSSAGVDEYSMTLAGGAGGGYRPAKRISGTDVVRRVVFSDGNAVKDKIQYNVEYPNFSAFKQDAIEIAHALAENALRKKDYRDGDIPAAVLEHTVHEFMDWLDAIGRDDVAGDRTYMIYRGLEAARLSEFDALRAVLHHTDPTSTVAKEAAERLKALERSEQDWPPIRIVVRERFAGSRTTGLGGPFPFIYASTSEVDTQVTVAEWPIPGSQDSGWKRMPDPTSTAAARATR